MLLFLFSHGWPANVERAFWPAKSAILPTFFVCLLQHCEDAATNGGMAG
jgi:hypothetical protein